MCKKKTLVFINWKIHQEKQENLRNFLFIVLRRKKDWQSAQIALSTYSLKVLLLIAFYKWFMRFKSNCFVIVRD